MIGEPNYEEILKAKIEYYGETAAAHEFAADEYARQWAKNGVIVELNRGANGKVVSAGFCRELTPSTDVNANTPKTPREIAEKYVYGRHDALTDEQEIRDMVKDIESLPQSVSKQSELNEHDELVNKTNDIHDIIERLKSLKSYDINYSEFEGGLDITENQNLEGEYIDVDDLNNLLNKIKEGAL
jgi:hypothetical protein